jgi:hypothetical protein
MLFGLDPWLIFLRMVVLTLGSADSRQRSYRVPGESGLHFFIHFLYTRASKASFQSWK